MVNSSSFETRDAANAGVVEIELGEGYKGEEINLDTDPDQVSS